MKTTGNERLSQISRWLPLFVLMAIISLFSTDSFSNDNTAGIFEPLLRAVLGRFYSEQFFDHIHYMIRKSSHFSEYAVLGGLWYRAVNPGLHGWSRKAAAAASTLSIIFAGLDEFHQAFTSSREGSLPDIMIDSAGVLTAIAVIWFYNKLAGSGVNKHE